jgi:hypothetical protein
MEEKKKKGIAPTEEGELPNEKRCKNCFGLLNPVEDSKGNTRLWCYRCSTAGRG